jgi:dephospho-CoA kinase
MTRPLTVALTGGIGSGKSTVSGMFAALGVPVIDADEISRRISRPGGAAYPAMVALLGTDVLASDGSIRRDCVRKRVFQDDALRRSLEEIVHPLVREEISRSVAGVEFPYCIVSIPLLVETGAVRRFDRVLVVDAPEDLQIARTMNRDGADAADVIRIQQRQAGRMERLAMADDVIDNRGDLGALRDRVRELHDMYVALAAGPAPERAPNGVARGGEGR